MPSYTTFIKVEPVIVKEANSFREILLLADHYLADSFNKLCIKKIFFSYSEQILSVENVYYGNLK